MAPKNRMDLGLRYDALSHQSLLWIDSYGKAKVIAEMPLPYVENVLNILEREDLANENHPLVIALNARFDDLSDEDDFDEDDESDDDYDLNGKPVDEAPSDLDELLASDLLPTPLKSLLKVLADTGVVEVRKIDSND